ncbi:MAG: 30S ribosomal protein S1, partial [Nitrospinota bacterium]
ISGTIVNISHDYATVDVGFKSEGIIPLFEFPEGGRLLKIGEEIEVFLEKTENSDGDIVLSKEKADRMKVWDKISNIYENDEIIEGTVTARIKGGFAIDVGLKGFLPGSQVDLRPVKQLDKLVGQKLEMKIIKMNKKRGNIVLSRRVILEKERSSSRQTILATLEEGKVLEGVVKNITDYGAFIDLGGVDGLLHITDMSWGRISHPSELFTIGDTVNVMVLKYDRETERVSLGFKQISEDPWLNSDEKFPVGKEVKGKVVSVTDYGAFIELEVGIEGLVHISEMTWNKYMKTPSKIVGLGDIVDAKVLSIDKDSKKISLSMKQVDENPWDNIETKYPVGSIVEGKVRTLTDFGAFVELEDGIDGLIYISDMSWTTKVKHPSEIVTKKEIVKAKILNIDKDSGRISLGLKQLNADPWETLENKYVVGEDVTGIVVKVTNFGAFVKIEDGVEGLVHASQLSSEKVTNPKSFIQADEEVTAKIIKVDIPNRKIGLSIKAFKEGTDVTTAEIQVSESSEEDTSGEG